MERVLSDGFILDCANPLKVFSTPSLQLIRNHVSNGRLQIGLFDTSKWLNELSKYREGNEIQKFVYSTVMSWFSAGRFKKINVNFLEVRDTSISDDFSSIWLNKVEDEEMIIDYLDSAGFLSLIKKDILEDHYDWLFKITDLPTIEPNQNFSWEEYLKDIVHYTQTIKIWDRYFFYNWGWSLSSLINPFLDFNPNLKVQIVGDLDSDNRSYEYGQKNINDMKNEMGQSLKLYRLKPEYGAQFHDRYMMTDYALLKIEPGFGIMKGNKSFRRTTPTIIGRYSEANHKWREEYASWSKRVKKCCREIEV